MIYSLWNPDIYKGIDSEMNIYYNRQGVLSQYLILSKIQNIIKLILTFYEIKLSRIENIKSTC